MSLAVDILKKHGKAALVDMLVIAIMPAIKEAVKKSSTPVDDILFVALEKPLQDELLKLADKLLAGKSQG